MEEPLSAVIQGVDEAWEVCLLKFTIDGHGLEGNPLRGGNHFQDPLDQIVGQASRLGWTVGVTSEDLVGAQCRAVVGLGGAKTDEWYSGSHMKGVWYQSLEDAGAHQRAMNCVFGFVLMAF